MIASPAPPPSTAPPFLRCDQCGIVLGADSLNTATPVPCPSCRSLILGQVFPALFRVPAAGEPGEALSVPGDAEATCFFHPRHRAATPCGQCGRFLCRLCDLDFGDGRHLCPECVRAGRTRGGMPELENERAFHDKLAGLLAVTSVFLGPLALLLAPATLYLVVRYWHEPNLGPVPRAGARRRLVFAALLAVVAFVGWTLWLLFLFRGLF